MKVLLIKCSALGDVVRTTALLAPLRGRFSDLELWWVASPEAAALLEGHPYIARVLPLSPQLGGTLAGESFDRILNLEEDPDCARLEDAVEHSRWTGVVLRSGALAYTPDSAPYYDMSLLHAEPDGSHARADDLKKANTRSFEEIWLRILGIEVPRPLPQPTLYLSPAERLKALELARSLGLDRLARRIAVCPGAGSRWPSKRMPDELVLKLSRAVSERWGVPLLLLGGPEERDANPSLAARSRGALIDLGTGHELRAYAALVDLLDAVVTTDSLTLHLANAFAKPVAALFGPTTPHEISLARGIKLTPPGGCACFYRKRCGKDDSCMGAFSAGTVVSALETAMATDAQAPT